MMNLRGLANELALIAFPRAGQDSAKYKANSHSKGKGTQW